MVASKNGDSQVETASARAARLQSEYDQLQHDFAGDEAQKKRRELGSPQDYLTLILGAVLGVIGVAFSWKGLSLKPVPKWTLTAASLGILVIVEGIVLTLIK